MSAPDGTVDETNAWVDDDPDRAREAITAELDREHPRRGVIDHAEKVIAEATPIEVTPAVGRAARAGQVTYRHPATNRTRTVTPGTLAADRYARFDEWVRVD